MEFSIAMLQEEEQVTKQGLRASSVQDSTLRKLQCAVTCCLLGLCTLAVPTGYLMVGSFIIHRGDKAAVQSSSESVLNTSAYKASGSGKGQDYSSDKSNTLQWEDQHGQAFTQNGMNYINRSLQIPKTGSYFVYSQVTFHLADLRCNESGQEKVGKKVDFVFQTITKVNSNYPASEDLLKGTKSLCEKENLGNRPIYLGALLLMKRGDRLMVKVSDIKLVDVTMEHKTFFGAFLV
ncbi:tumor necrosis factor ligand superfamily member 15 isoform X2 [Ascaphus truei]|uniref:tumor necrosis factor ligand superfamily member 15 isoform X2 n=1 Tax=Ascaphus truei TaxID=8439 RepID=UPI003F5A79CB